MKTDDDSYAHSYQLINRRAANVVTKLGELEKLYEGQRARLLRVLKDMYDLFSEKPPDLKLGEFGTFQEWAEALVAPLLHLKPRGLFHSLKVAKHLVNKISDEEIERLGHSRCVELAKVAESKGKVSKALVERAMDLTVAELRIEVRQLLFRGNPDHEQDQPWEHMYIEGPREHTRWLKNFLALSRRTEGMGKSDAELLRDHLALECEEMLAAAERQKEEASGYSEAASARHVSKQADLAGVGVRTG
jgi:hypothetical protein